LLASKSFFLREYKLKVSRQFYKKKNKRTKREEKIDLSEFLVEYSHISFREGKRRIKLEIAIFAVVNV